MRPLLAGAVVLLAAVVASTSSGIARGAFLDWQDWGTGAAHRPSVSVAYVWESNYGGLDWPEQPTEVLRVQGPRRSHYWRATTLDAFRDGRWIERAFPLGSPQRDPLLPERARSRPSVRQEVEVTGLVDTHLPAAPTPVRYETSMRVRYSAGGVAHVAGIDRGQRYQAWSYAPKPTPKQLAAARPYTDPAVAPYLSLAGLAAFAPVFDAPDRAKRMEQLFAASPDDRAYRPLYERALAVAGRAASPYAAVVALESWFRTDGGFAYDDRPPRAAGRPALVDFVERTKAGYCQHFAGAMALMLRYLGIPARVGAGFTSGSYADGTWIVTDRDAHTWVEAYFPGWGWLPFDPTPGRGQLDGSYTVSSSSFDASGAAAQLPPGSPLRNDLAQRARANPQIVGERPTSRGGGPLRPIAGAKRSLPVLLVLALVALAVGTAIWLAKLLLRRARLARARDPHAVALACRRALAAYAADQGLDLPEGSTLRELVPFLRQQLGVDAGELAAAATAAAYAPPCTRGGRGGQGAERAAAAPPRTAREPARVAAAPRRALASVVVIAEAVVMAAGEGRRLRPLTERWPKPVLPIDGRPVIATLLRELAAAGVERATVVVGHLAEQIERLVGEPGAFPLEVRFAAQPEPLGSADAVVRALDADARPPLLIAAADTVFVPGDVARLARAFAGSAAEGAIAVRREPAPDPPHRYGTRVEAGRVTRVLDDDPGTPLSGAPLWAIREPIVPLLARDAPPHELGRAFQRAVEAGMTVLGIEIGRTRDLTGPVDLVEENFPYLRGRE